MASVTSACLGQFSLYVWPMPAHGIQPTHSLQAQETGVLIYPAKLKRLCDKHNARRPSRRGPVTHVYFFHCHIQVVDVTPSPPMTHHGVTCPMRVDPTATELALLVGGIPLEIYCRRRMPVPSVCMGKLILRSWHSKHISLAGRVQAENTLPQIVPHASGSACRWSPVGASMWMQWVPMLCITTSDSQHEVLLYHMREVQSAEASALHLTVCTHMVYSSGKGQY